MFAILSAIIVLKALTSQSDSIRQYVTPLIISLILRQMWISKLLQKLRSPVLTRIVTISADTVCVEFYAVSLPLIAWCVLHEAS